MTGRLASQSINARAEPLHFNDQRPCLSSQLLGLCHQLAYLAE
jgi:hypothetical protein